MGRYGDFSRPDATSDLRRIESDVLRPIQAINLEYLDAIAHLSSREVLSPEVVTLHAEISSLEPAARHALANGPLLVDFAFGDEERWSGAFERPKATQDALGRCGNPMLGIARSTLMLGWYLVRGFPEVSSMLLGVAPKCASIIADLDINALEWIAESRSEWLQPRWSMKSLPWRALVDSARQFGKTALEAPSSRVLQLSAARFLPVSKYEFK